MPSAVTRLVSFLEKLQDRHLIRCHQGYLRIADDDVEKPAKSDEILIDSLTFAPSSPVTHNYSSGDGGLTFRNSEESTTNAIHP